MKINEILIKANQQLRKNNIASAILDAEVLLSFVLNKPREFLFKHPGQKITKNQLKKFNFLIKRRLNLEPVAYLVQKKEFYGLNFYVDRRVLIPRSETETLVEEIIKSIKKNSDITIADIGTGSGCIAVVLAKHLPKAKIVAIDISQNALEVAKINAKKHKVSIKIIFHAGDLLKPITKPVDIIVANLPYLPKKDINKEIKYEPKNSLFGKKEGREFIEKLLQQAPEKLSPKGKIFLEIHPPQLKNLKKVINASFPRAKVKVIKDLAGLNRIVAVIL